MQGVVTLVAISMVIFALARLTGNPLDVLLPPEAPQEYRAETAKALGLDRPLYVQYFVFVGHAVRGDFGNSIRASRPVTSMVLERLPATAKLVGFSTLVGILVAVPLGILAAIRRGSYVDRIVQMISVVGMAVPPFWLSLMLIQLFSVKLGLTPVAGIGGLDHYLLPGFSLGLWFVAGMTRLVRSSMLETLDQEYIKMARIKGLSEALVIWKHALRNSLIAPVTFAAMYLGLAITGAVLVEVVFAWPGIGRLAYEAVVGRDFPVIQAVVIILAAGMIVLNLLVDILYAYIDPRIRYG